MADCSDFFYLFLFLRQHIDSVTFGQMKYGISASDFTDKFG